MEVFPNENFWKTLARCPNCGKDVMIPTMADDFDFSFPDGTTYHYYRKGSFFVADKEEKDLILPAYEDMGRVLREGLGDFQQGKNRPSL